MTGGGAREPETVRIVDLSRDGRGVAGTEGKTLFVDGALPGETASVLRMRRRRRFDEARVENVLDASPDRVEPVCAHFGRCGGCSLQHLAPRAQLEAKYRMLEENLRREGGTEPATRFEALAGPSWGYRRRARLGVRYVAKKGRVLVGFSERYKPYVADLDGCPVLSPPAGELIRPLADMVGQLSISTRLPQIEVSVADNRTALVLRVLDAPTPEDRMVLASFQSRHDVDIYLQPGGIDTVTPLAGAATPLSYRLPEFDLEFEFLPTDFIQVNADLNAIMVERAIELLEIGPGVRVLDLFCGLGNFSLPMARRGAIVTGVEGTAGLVDRARQNARRNRLAGVSFYTADLSADCSAESWSDDSYDAVLLDPPRAGAERVLPLIASTSARKIVYVSCNPETLGRDVGRLIGEHGYRLEGAGVMDMFPHTTHIESIALLEKAGD